jgi:hypothetical protein
MKNIHILPTDKPSNLFKDIKNKLMFNKDWIEIPIGRANQNIYITSDEEIKEGDWYLIEFNGLKITQCTSTEELISIEGRNDCKKIILTTDQDLIKDGVQAIDDEFLQWFVKNPSCEEVEIYEVGGKLFAEPIIPKEEPKQETLEEAAEKHFRSCWKTFNEIDYLNFGAKWQQEQDKNKYSEEEVEIIIQKLMNEVHCGDLCYGDNVIDFKMSPRQWFEQFKK